MLAILAWCNANAADYALNFGGDKAGTVSATGSATDAAGNVFIAATGTYTGRFNGVPYTVYEGGNAIVVKTDPSGKVVWVKGFGGHSSSVHMSLTAIAAGPDSSVVVAGRLDDGTLETPPLTKLGYVDGFVTKLDADGNLLWTHHFGGAKAYAAATGVAVDPNGYVLVTGNYSNASLSEPPTVPTDASFAARYDALGNAQWVRSYSPAMAFGKVASDAGGNGYVAGTLAGSFGGLVRLGAFDGLAVKLDASTGDVAWASNFGGPGAAATAVSVSLDAGGNVFIGAELSRTAMTVPAVSLIGEQDMVALKLDSAGTVQWARNYGGPALFAQVASTAATSSGHLLLAGRYGRGTSGLTNPALPRIGPIDSVLMDIDPAGALVRTQGFGGTTAYTRIVGIGRDAADNAYPIGNISYGAMTQPPLVTKTKDESIFAFRIDTAGTIARSLEYVATYGAEATVTASTADASGNLVVTGTFETMRLTGSGVDLDGVGDVSTFVTKVDPWGSVAWAKAFGIPSILNTTTNLRSSGIARDASGNLYVAGLSRVASYGTGAVTSSFDGFLFKLDADGNTLWFRNFGGARITEVNALAVDSAGRVIVAGAFAAGNLASPAIQHIGFQDAFVIAFDSGGTVAWSTNAGGPITVASARGLATDASGNVFVAGSFDWDLTSPAVTRRGTTDAFLLKLDSSGQPVFITSFGGGSPSAYAVGNAVAVAPSGKIYFAGDFGNSDIAQPSLQRVGTGQHGMLIALDAQGTIEWSAAFGSSDGYATSAVALAVDPGGDVLAGVSSGTLHGLDVPGVGASGAQGAYALRYSPSGNLVWSQSFGGRSAYAEARSIAVDGAGNAFLGGIFAGGDMEVPPLQKIGGADAFVVKLRASNGPATAPLSLSPTGPLHRGQKSIVFAATSGAPPAGGTIVVSIDGKSCPIFLSAGVGTCQLETSVVGNRVVTGHYTGDGNYAARDVSAPLTVLPTLDVDADGASDSLTDGLLILRYAFGLRGAALTTGAIGVGASRTSPVEIAGYLDQVRSTLDVDGDGKLDALTDGVVILRYLFGLRGDSLTTGAVSGAATRPTPSAVETYIDSLLH